MSNSSFRTVLLFSIIALVLVGATVGGVRIIKARNDSYAASQREVAQTDTKQQPQPAQQKADTSKQPQSQDTSNKNNAVPPVTNPTPTPAASDTKSTSTPQTASTPQQHSNLPATSSFTPGEVLPTIVLMGLAGFFGNKLLRARADYRRYIGL